MEFIEWRNIGHFTTTETNHWMVTPQTDKFMQ